MQTVKHWVVESVLEFLAVLMLGLHAHEVLKLLVALLLVADLLVVVDLLLEVVLVLQVGGHALGRLLHLVLTVLLDGAQQVQAFLLVLCLPALILDHW